MFGYIRPIAGELLVREHELYRAAYCGLCGSMGRSLTRLAPLALDYDLVFLCLMRMAITGEQPAPERFHCAFKGGRRKSRLDVDSPALKYVAACAGLLVYYKLRDDINDTRNLVRKAAYLLALPAARRMRRKAARAVPGLEEGIAEQIGAITALEKAGETSPDRLAHHNALLMAHIASHALEGEQAEIARKVGYHVGRWIYLLDAIDDLRRDARTGEYNVLLRRFGGVEGALEALPALGDSLELSCADIARAFEVAPSAQISGILRNIIYLGMPHTQHKVMQQTLTGKPDRKKLHGENV